MVLWVGRLMVLLDDLVVVYVLFYYYGFGEVVFCIFAAG